jgi:beta-glucosidase
VVIFFGGLSSSLEGEEMRVDYKGFNGGDRTSIGLPEIQEDLIRKLKATGKPVVVVLLNGSALAVNWEDENIPAILEAWYPGEEGGNAIADVLFGNYNPSGRLPVTFYKSVDQLPPFEDYAMKGRTYRYFNGKPLYPFGYGLSFSRFSYSDLKLVKSAETGLNVNVSVEVTNSGKMEGDEIVQLYVSNRTAKVPVAIRSLEGFQRIRLKPGEKRTVSFILKPSQFSVIDENTKRMEQAGTFEISVGGGQPEVNKRTTSGFVTGTLQITGNPKELEL